MAKPIQEKLETEKVDEEVKLFSENMEYNETPTQKLQDKQEIRGEWQNIKDQEDINLDLEVWSRDEDKYIVKWHLEYTEDNARTVLNGIYLIKLNEENKCTEFWHYRLIGWLSSFHTYFFKFLVL
ncbi:MAG: hypothetical protein V5A72_02485 [Candidatus Nanohaloarchaea archaeon]